jgi:hypothetical protein
MKCSQISERAAVALAVNGITSPTLEPCDNESTLPVGGPFTTLSLSLPIDDNH